MSKQQKCSPIKQKPLRNPGQYLEEKVVDILYGGFLGYAVTLLFLLIYTITEWQRYYQPTPPNPWFLTGMTAIAFVVLSVLMYRSMQTAKRYKLGRDGEKYVGQYLENLRAKGYHVYHDVDTGRGNIDHVVIGPGGVFTIDTKTRSKDGNETIRFNGVSIIEGSGRPVAGPISQARAESKWMERFSSEYAGIGPLVQPVLVYPGWYIEKEVSGPTDVWVLNEKAFIQFLDYRREVLSLEQISNVSNALEMYIRSKQ